MSMYWRYVAMVEAVQRAVAHGRKRFGDFRQWFYGEMDPDLAAAAEKYPALDRAYRAYGPRAKKAGTWQPPLGAVGEGSESTPAAELGTDRAAADALPVLSATLTSGAVHAARVKGGRSAKIAPLPPIGALVTPSQRPRVQTLRDRVRAPRHRHRRFVWTS